MNNEQLSRLNDLSDQVGQFMQYWGFKKIHGQVWTHIYLSSQPITAQHLIQRLNVSKALISLTLKDLLDFKIVQEIKGTVKIKKYAANGEVINVICNILRERELKMLRQIRTEFHELKELNDVSEFEAKRIEKLEMMINFSIDCLEKVIDLSVLDLKCFSEIDA